MDAREIMLELRIVDAKLARVDGAEAQLLQRKRRLEYALEQITQPPPVDPNTDPDRPGDDPDLPNSSGAWVLPDEVGASVTATPIYKSFGHDMTKYLQAINVAFRAGQNTNAICNTLYSGTKGLPLHWDNVDVASDLAWKIKWGIIAFDVESWKFVNCSFRDIPVEHGLYLTAVGGFEFDGCLWDHCRSQGLQVVAPVGKRAMQTGLSDVQAKLLANAADWQIVRNSALIDCGDGAQGARPSYALSFFSGAPNPVQVTGSFLRTSLPFDNNGPRDCTGAIMVHNRSAVDISDCFIEYLNGDRSVIQLWRNGDTTVRGCEVHAAKPVDIRGRPGDIITIEGNKGSTCEVIISTNDTLNDQPPVDFNLNWDPSKVVYQGPLSEDFQVVL